MLSPVIASSSSFGTFLRPLPLRSASRPSVRRSLPCPVPLPSLSPRARCYRPRPRDREYVLYRHQERLVESLSGSGIYVSTASISSKMLWQSDCPAMSSDACAASSAFSALPFMIRGVVSRKVVLRKQLLISISTSSKAPDRLPGPSCSCRR